MRRYDIDSAAIGAMSALIESPDGDYVEAADALALLRRSELDSRLGDALRASGINAADALAVQALYATAGHTGSHRIVSALRAVEAWLREDGAL